MSRNKCIEDFIEEYENYSDIKDEARKKKYLKKIESNYTEYPNLLDWFNDIFFSKTRMLELYDCIYSYVHNEKMLYDNILNYYDYDTKTKSIAKFILDSFDNFEEDDSTKSEQSSSDIDDFSFEQDDEAIFEFKPNQIRGIENSISTDFASGIHSQATGTGKTIMMLNIMWLYHQKNPTHNMMWFCERKDIPKKIFFDKKNIDFYRNNGIIDLSNFIIIDFINDKPRDLNNYIMENKKKGKPFIIVINRAFATAKSTYWKLDKSKLYKYQEILGEYIPSFIAFDECHSSMANKTYEFLLYAKNIWKSKIQGMSATPYRKGNSSVSVNGITERLDNKQKLLNVFHKKDNVKELNIISWCNIKEAIENEYILEPIFHWFSINEYYSKSKTNDNIGEINSVFSVLDETLNTCPYKKCIVWCKIINNTTDWYRNFENNKNNYPNLKNMTFYIDHSKIDEESNKYDEFYNTPSNSIMFCANKYREGSDIPFLDCELFLDKVKDRAEIVYIQSIGRVLRKDKEKKKLNGHILDSFNNDDDKLKIKDIVNKILKYYFELYEISFNVKDNSFQEKSNVFNQILKNLKIEPTKKEISILLGNNKKITIDLAKIDISSLDWGSLIKEFKNVLTFEFEFSEEDEFNKLREEVQKHGLKSHIEYKSYAENEGFEKNPENKYGIYWKGWYDFLGIDKSIFVPTLAIWREKVKKLNIQTVTGYGESCNFNELNNNLPLYPNEIYKDFTSLYNEFKVIYPSYTNRR
jgi:superfamily II DNA or RNA helicase